MRYIGTFPSKELAVAANKIAREVFDAKKVSKETPQDEIALIIALAKNAALDGVNHMKSASLHVAEDGNADASTNHPEPPHLQTIEVTYTTPKLGLTIQVKPTKVPSSENPYTIAVKTVASDAPHSQLIQPNDVLVGINGMALNAIVDLYSNVTEDEVKRKGKETNEVFLGGIVKALKETKRPMMVQFERGADDETAKCKNGLCNGDGVEAMETDDADIDVTEETDSSALPEPWIELLRSSSGQRYYDNPSTNVTQWDRPSAESMAETGSDVVGEEEPTDVDDQHSSPDSLDEHVDPSSGRANYHNPTTNVTQWEHPLVETGGLM